MKAINVMDLIVDILIEDKEVLADLNKFQWIKGKRSTGAPIGKYKDGMYALEKYKMNSQAGAGYIDLMLTKTTVNSLIAEVQGDSIIFSLNSDIHELERIYGVTILGLNNESRAKYIYQFLLPKLLERVRNKLAA